jgi:hypothetical protein
MIQKKTELPLRLQDASNFSHCFVHLVYVFKDQTGDHSVKGVVWCRDLTSTTKEIPRATAPLYSYINMELRWVYAENIRTLGGQRASYLTITTTEVKDHVSASEFFNRKWDYLFNVLRVGTISEPIDPPLCVFIP